MPVSKITTLGVLSYGDSTGYPFSQCFSKIKSINKFEDFTDNIDAVVLWGGSDLSPSLYRQKANSFCQATDVPSKRDQFEYKIAKEAIKRAIPVIGVCRGAQLMCILSGGTLAQHVDHHGHGGHQLMTDNGKELYSNSCHHQMMLPSGGEGVDYNLIAWTAKNQATHYIGENNTVVYYAQEFREPEVVWFHKTMGLAIQGHPEWMQKDMPFVKYVLELIEDYIV